MALIFSQVRLKSDTDKTELLCSGQPMCHEDLSFWNIYLDFIRKYPEQDIYVDVETRAYGGSEEPDHDATPEEIAYFYVRRSIDHDFIRNRTMLKDSKNFVIKPDDRISWDYEISLETPEILGSGSSYSCIVHARTLTDALAALNNGRNHMTRQGRVQGYIKMQYYDICTKTWT